MNECSNWKHINYFNGSNEVDLQDVYGSDPQKLSVIIEQILGVWELSLGKGIIKRRVADRCHFLTFHEIVRMKIYITAIRHQY